MPTPAPRLRRIRRVKTRTTRAEALGKVRECSFTGTPPIYGVCAPQSNWVTMIFTMNSDGTWRVADLRGNVLAESVSRHQVAALMVQAPDYTVPFWDDARRRMSEAGVDADRAVMVARE